MCFRQLTSVVVLLALLVVSCGGEDPGLEAASGGGDPVAGDRDDHEQGGTTEGGREADDSGTVQDSTVEENAVEENAVDKNAVDEAAGIDQAVDDEQAYAAAFSANFVGSQGQGGGDAAVEAEAQCVGTEAVDLLGVDRMQLLGTPEALAAGGAPRFELLGLSSSEAEMLAAAVVDCAPSLLEGLRETIVNDQAPEPIRQCFDKLVDTEGAAFMRTSLTAAFLGDNTGGRIEPFLLQCVPS